MQSIFTQSLQKNFFFDSSVSKLQYTNFLPNSESHNRESIHSLDKNDVKIYKTSFFAEDLTRDFKRGEGSFPFMSNYREINYWIDSGRPPCTFGLVNHFKFSSEPGFWPPEMYVNEPTIIRPPQYHVPLHKPLLTDDAIETIKDDLFISNSDCAVNKSSVKRNENKYDGNVVADTRKKDPHNFRALNGKCKNGNVVQISKESQTSSGQSKQIRKRNKKKVNFRSIGIGPDPESTSSGSNTIMLTLSKVKSKRIHQKFLKKTLDGEARKAKVKRNIFQEKTSANNCLDQDRLLAGRSNSKGIYNIGRKDKGDVILKKLNLEDDSEVSVLTANYIRSTKRNAPIKKGRRQCILQLIKDSDDIDNYCNNRRNQMASKSPSRNCCNSIIFKNGDVKKSLRPIVVCHKLNGDLLKEGLVCYSCCNDVGDLLSKIKVNSSHQQQNIASGSSSSEIFGTTTNAPKAVDESSTDNLTKYKKAHIDSIECKPGSIELHSNLDRCDYDSSDERIHEFVNKTCSVNRTAKRRIKDRAVHRQHSLALRHSKIKRKNTSSEILNKNVKGTQKTVKQYKQMLCVITDSDSSDKSKIF